MYVVVFSTTMIAPADSERIRIYSVFEFGPGSTVRTTAIQYELGEFVDCIVGYVMVL
jgi:hypothetical protein